MQSRTDRKSTASSSELGTPYSVPSTQYSVPGARRIPRRRPNRAFTLVEMLVVIAIIAVLAALLVPAVMIAIRTARNAVIALEIKQIEAAIEQYRLEKGDYPPNFRDPEIIRRHITKCYPRINAAYFDAFMTKLYPSTGALLPTPPTTAAVGSVPFDEAECLVFWLSMTDTNPQYPFLAFFPWPQTGSGTKLEVNAKRFYDFEEARLQVTTSASTTNGNSREVASFKAKFAQDTFYLYLDSRSYDKPLTEYRDLGRVANEPTAAPSGYPPQTFAFSRTNPSGHIVRPYWSMTKNPNALTSPGTTAAQYRNQFKPVNATTFQLICAGQDGDFGSAVGDTGVKVFNIGDTVTGTTGVLEYTEGDKDNITNFSGGRTLGDNVP